MIIKIEVDSMSHQWTVMMIWVNWGWKMACKSGEIGREKWMLSQGS